MLLILMGMSLKVNHLNYANPVSNSGFQNVEWVVLYVFDEMSDRSEITA